MRRTASVGKRSKENGIWTRGASNARQPSRGFVVCISNSEYLASLELHKIYRVAPDHKAALDGDLRIVDERGEDYLYPARWFVAVKLPRRIRGSLLSTP